MKTEKELEQLKISLTCTMCGEKQETYSEIVFSQGDRVCLDCKKITLPSDKRAFDRYINSHFERTH